MIVGLFLMVTSIALVSGCVLACSVKWYELKGPGRYRGDEALVAWFGRADVLLNRASSNMVPLYGAEMLACAASLIFGYGIASAIASIITIVLTAWGIVLAIIFIPLCIGCVSASSKD